MRIGIDATSLLCPHPRGEGKTLLRLYQEIARLRPDLDFVLFGERRAGQSCAIPELPRSRIVLFDCPGFRWNTWENFGLPWQAWRQRCDVLHCSSSGTPFWSPIPVVMTVHDVIPLVFDDGQSAAQRQRFARRLQHGLRIADAVVAVSAHTRADLQRLFPRAADAVRVVHWGADAAPELRTPEESSPCTGDYILAFGGGALRKNTAMTLRAFAQTSVGHPALRLVLLGVGTPAEQKAVMALAEEYGVADRIVLPGFISEAELPRYYRHALCLMYLSLYEGFGVPLLEAMAHGVPVLASARTSIPEVVGEDAILVDPQNLNEIVTALSTIIGQPELRQSLGRKAQHRVRQFSWENCAQRMLPLLGVA